MTAFTSEAMRELSARGLVEQTTDPEALDAALAGGSLVFYAGFDPTGPSLHAGHLVPIMAMRRLQQLGHRPIVVLGGGTARVGDPSGKSETRKLLSGEQIAANTAAIGRQIGRFLPLRGGAEVVDNFEWLGELKYIDFLREVGVHFTVNRMITTKTYRDRLDAEEPLSFIEFNYQLFQAYDYLQLHRTRSCTLQIGGGDQWGNVVAGAELIRRFGLGPAHAIVFPLLTTASGAKMGKTEEGSVWLDPDLTPPFDYYQYWIGCDDRDVGRMLKIFTDLPLAEIEQLASVEGAALREVKARLAFEATAIAHGKDAAAQAAAAARQAFGGGDDWSAVPAVEIDCVRVKLIDLVVDRLVGAFPSKRAARQRIEEGAIRVNGVVIREPEHELVSTGPSGLRIQVGKRHRLRLILRPDSDLPSGFWSSWDALVESRLVPLFQRIAHSRWPSPVTRPLLRNLYLGFVREAPRWLTRAGDSVRDFKWRDKLKMPLEALALTARRRRHEMHRLLQLSLRPESANQKVLEAPGEFLRTSLGSLLAKDENDQALGAAIVLGLFGERIDSLLLRLEAGSFPATVRDPAWGCPPVQDAHLRQLREVVATRHEQHLQASLFGAHSALSVCSQFLERLERLPT